MKSYHFIFGLFFGSFANITLANDAAQNQSRDQNPEQVFTPQLQVTDIRGSFDWQKVEASLPTQDSAWYSTRPEPLVEGWRQGELRNSSAILQLTHEIAKGEHRPIDSLLITSRNRLVFEAYFAHGRANLPHFQASASKSYTAFAIGRAMELGYLSMEDLHKPIVDFFDEIDATKLVPGSDKITLHHTLSMRSGMRFSEVQNNAMQQLSDTPQKLAGQKLAEVYLTHSAPITDASQSYYYQSADTRLSMLVLQAVLPVSTQEFIKTELLNKLGISQYYWGDHISGISEAAHSTSFTSRDMSIWGILLKQWGRWEGEQLISKAFLKQGTGKVAQPGSQTNDFDYSNFRYGYYFWGTRLQGRGVDFEVNMAWGGGGQYIMSFEELDLVVVVTARGRGLEDKILDMVEQRILPSFYINRDYPTFTGPLMGQKPPGKMAEVFVPDIISTPGWDIQGLFSPDMKEFYYVTDQGEGTPIMVVGFREEQNVWKKHMEFIRRGELTFSPDGSRMLMARGYRDRINMGWSERKSSSPLIQQFPIMRLSAAADDTWVFDEARVPGVIRISTVVDGERQAPVIMGEMVNQGELAAHPFIAPDGSYIIWDAIREGGYGKQDLYITFKQADGSWGDAINMGPQVNSANGDTYATVLADGKYLMFNRRIDDATDNTDIMWVDASFIKDLRSAQKIN